MRQNGDDDDSGFEVKNENVGDAYRDRGGVTVNGVGFRGSECGGLLLNAGGEAEPDGGEGATVDATVVAGAPVR